METPSSRGCLETGGCRGRELSCFEGERQRHAPNSISWGYNGGVAAMRARTDSRLATRKTFQEGSVPHMTRNMIAAATAGAPVCMQRLRGCVNRWLS